MTQMYWFNYCIANHLQMTNCTQCTIYDDEYFTDETVGQIILRLCCNQIDSHCRCVNWRQTTSVDRRTRSRANYFKIFILCKISLRCWYGQSRVKHLPSTTRLAMYPTPNSELPPLNQSRKYGFYTEEAAHANHDDKHHYTTPRTTTNFL